MSTLYSFLPLVTGIVIFMIGLVVKIYQPRQSLPKVFLLLCASVMFWTLGYAVNYQADSPSIALWACRAAFIGVIFIPSTTLHFVIKLLKLNRCKVLVVGGYLVSTLFLFVIWGDVFFKGVTEHFWGFYPVAGPIYVFFVGYYGLVFVSCVGLLFFAYKKQPSLQVKYVLIAFFVALWSLVDYLPNYGVEIYPFAYLCALGWIGTISYAISRHRLFDIEAVIDVIHRDRLAMLGLLSASVNHEIKNPLYIMRGQFDLLKQMEGVSKDARVSRCLDQMDVQIQRIQKLLKMYSSVGTQDQLSGASVQESLRNVIEFLDFEIKRRSIRIEWNSGDVLPPVRCARFELESIVLNLLLNACQAIDSEGKVTIQTEVTAEYVCIRVKDTGPGLSKDQQRRVFEPLYTTKPEGGGLGLFITKSMIEKHGGQLKVISELGQGALFEVLLRKAN